MLEVCGSTGVFLPDWLGVVSGVLLPSIDVCFPLPPPRRRGPSCIGSLLDDEDLETIKSLGLNFWLLTRCVVTQSPVSILFFRFWLNKVKLARVSLLTTWARTFLHAALCGGGCRRLLSAWRRAAPFHGAIDASLRFSWVLGAQCLRVGAIAAEPIILNASIGNAFLILSKGGFATDRFFIWNIKSTGPIDSIRIEKNCSN